MAYLSELRFVGMSHSFTGSVSIAGIPVLPFKSGVEDISKSTSEGASETSSSSESSSASVSGALLLAPADTAVFPFAESGTATGVAVSAKRDAHITKIAVMVDFRVICGEYRKRIWMWYWKVKLQWVEFI